MIAWIELQKLAVSEPCGATVHWFFADRIMIGLRPLEARTFRHSVRTLCDLDTN
jgi:hypothetical protein